MPTNKTSYWKRVGYVEIEGEDGMMHKYGGSHDGLDFRFDIKYVADISVEFSVGILGLGRDTIQKLTVWNIAQAISASRKIAVYAGYEKDGVARQVASGIITNAIPTSPPEMWLNFSCLVGKCAFEPTNGKCITDAKLSEILEYLAKANGLSARWDAKRVKPDTKVPKFYVGCAPTWIVSKFASTYSLLVYIDGNELVATDIDAWNTNKIVESSDLISPETGLISVGKIDLKGATIKRRLDTRSRLMSWVRLESNIIPSANNSYYVVAKRHVGQYRGEDWFTELETIRRVSR